MTAIPTTISKGVTSDATGLAGTEHVIRDTGTHSFVEYIVHTCRSRSIVDLGLI